MVPNTNISGIGNRTNKTITMRGLSNYQGVGFPVRCIKHVEEAPLR